ncbi:hypothetical protein [Halorhodospira halophila]|uniref:Uncharacterized protein n=1 Tax=Halorhodospira halophila (strain DSM 244 / SL1) TaxID=349124 RepID=A1WWK8_HALHL|nr:hypothetical protein [Halorhodospira halophila]ABM62070.1 hypothetical protein Hhal_1301 [Halorhodospira halophila SL1]
MAAASFMHRRSSISASGTNTTPENAVWGVGQRLADRLAELGIQTTEDLARLPPRRIRQHFPVTLARTAEELRGCACHDLESEPAPRQQIVCSRTFGTPVRDKPALREAVADYAARAQSADLVFWVREAGGALVPTDGVMHNSPLGTGTKVGALAGLLPVRENASIAPLHHRHGER